MKQYLKLSLSILVGIIILSAFLPSIVLADTFYFKVHKIFDGENWLTPGYIHIAGKKITYVGEVPLDKKSSYKYIEKSTLLPALVDAHQHLTIIEPEIGVDYEKAFRFSDKLSFKEKKTLGLSILNDYLHKGFLYIRDLGGDDLALRAIKKESEKQENYPFIQWSTKPVAHGHGQCPKDLNCKRYFQDLNNIQYKKGETLKVYLDNEPFPGLLSPLELQSILKKHHKFVAFHTIFPYPLRELIPYLDANDSLEHIQSISSQQLKILAPTKVRLIPTDLPQSLIENYKEKIPPWPFEEFKIQSKRMQRLIPYTSQLCFGSDFYIDPHDQVRTRAYWAIESFLQQVKRLKLSSTKALQIITSQCASLFSKHQKLGKIKKGLKANFIIVEGDLSKDLSLLHNIQWVIKEGKVLVQP